MAAVLAGGSTLPALPASAQQPAESSSDGGEESGDARSDKQRFRELGRAGGHAFAKKDYKAAEEAFKEAYEIEQVPNLLYNIGRAIEKQGDFDRAISYYEKFVNEADVELKARQDALQRLKTLREVLALREEGEAVDREQLDPAHRERGLAAHEAPASQDVAKEGDSDKEAPSVSDDVEHDDTLAYIFGATGVATLIGSGVFAGLAASEKSDFDDAQTLSGRRNAADTGQTYTTVADSMLVTGAVFAAAGVYFWATGSVETAPDETAPDETAPEQTPAERGRLVPSIGPNRASVTFSLDF